MGSTFVVGAPWDLRDGGFPAQGALLISILRRDWLGGMVAVLWKEQAKWAWARGKCVELQREQHPGLAWQQRLAVADAVQWTCGCLLELARTLPPGRAGHLTEREASERSGRLGERQATRRAVRTVGQA